MSTSFKLKLLELGNELRNSSGFPDTSNPEDAAVQVLTQVLVAALGKSGHLPVAGTFRETEATVASTFLCFLASPVVIHLKQEGAEVSINELVARSGLAAFHFLEENIVARSISNGMEEYKMLIRTGKAEPKLKDFVDTVNEGIFTYVITKDKRLHKAFGSLFSSLLDAWESM